MNFSYYSTQKSGTQVGNNIQKLNRHLTLSAKDYDKNEQFTATLEWNQHIRKRVE